MSGVWRSSSTDYPKDSELERAWLRGYSIGREDMLHIRTALLAKLRDEVGDLVEFTETEAYKRAGFYYDRDDVDALLEKELG